MTVKKTVSLFFAAILTFAIVFPALSAGWDYPLSPLVAANLGDYLVLANKEHLLSSDYEPTDLTKLSVRRAVDDPQLRKAAADALRDMFDAAEKDGCVLYVKSAYRNYRTQNTMYYNRLSNIGHDDGMVQAPGASDHQTGLGVDVLNYEWTKKDGMNAKFASEREAVWMAEHCWEYGFVIRYQSDKEDITGIKYEPWHLRYVGIEAAAYMHEKNYALEEFWEDYRRAVADYESAGGDFMSLVYLLNRPNEKRIVEVLANGEEEYSAFYD